MDNKTNQATRVLRIIDLLKGRSTSGLSNKVISESLGESPVNISRALAILMQEGFVTKLDNGFYALSIKVTQIGVKTCASSRRGNVIAVTPKKFANGRCDTANIGSMVSGNHL